MVRSALQQQKQQQKQQQLQLLDKMTQMQHQHQHQQQLLQLQQSQSLQHSQQQQITPGSLSSMDPKLLKKRKFRSLSEALLPSTGLGSNSNTSSRSSSSSSISSNSTSSNSNGNESVSSGSSSNISMNNGSELSILNRSNNCTVNNPLSDNDQNPVDHIHFKAEPNVDFGSISQRPSKKQMLNAQSPTKPAIDFNVLQALQNQNNFTSRQSQFWMNVNLHSM